MSDVLQAATFAGPTVVARGEVWVDGQHAGDLSIVDGEVSYDATGRVLRSCDVTLAGDLPTGPDHPLAPSGSELRLWRGVVDRRTGQVHEAPVGRYAFDESLVERGDRTVQVVGYDYSQLVTDARWEAPYTIDRGTPVVGAIVEAVRSRLPEHLWQNPNLVSDPSTCPAIVWGEERDNDPWQDVTKLAADAGLDVGFDREGRLTVQPVPDPDDAPVAVDLTVGDSPVLLTLSRELDGRPYNVVVAVSEPPADPDDPDAEAPPPVGPVTVADDDIRSPSYVGRYRRPYFMAISFATTLAMVEAAARGQLRRLLGMGEVVELSVVPMPWLDVGNVIRAVDPDLHVDARYVIDRYTLPLRPGTSTIVTRRRRL